MPHLPVPAAPALTQQGLCSACGAAPVSICKGEVQICRNCLAVLWHLRRPGAAEPPRPVSRRPGPARISQST
jgi:hypothetical protein